MPMEIETLASLPVRGYKPEIAKPTTSTNTVFPGTQAETESFERPPPPYDQPCAAGETLQLGEQSGKKRKTRLIICIDGTYCDPDGTDTGYEGNSTNVFRVSTIVREGILDDGEWTQKVVYRPGLNNSWWLHKKLSGAFGHGLEAQIKDTYQLICEHNLERHDELFLFGFSRGAYTVRAVAGLLHWMKIPKMSLSSAEFERHFSQCLALYQDKKCGSQQRQNSIFNLTKNCREPPIIKFVGVFDTVKAFDDHDLYDIKLNSSIIHARQALALNERRTAFSPDVWTVGPKEATDFQEGTRTMLQAWFLGRHSEIGGSNKEDGLSLYPLQWMLSQAHDCGLILGGYIPAPYHDQDGNERCFEDTKELVFPTYSGQSLTSTNTGPFFMTHSNGIVTKLWDMRRVHASNAGYRIKLPSGLGNRLLYTMKDRVIFEYGELIGYHEDEPFGTFVHPSVYMIFELEVPISVNSEGWNFKRHLLSHKDKIRWTEGEMFWTLPSEDIDGRLKAVRILICGEAGIGKSTLINKVFGAEDLTPTSKTEHGVHDVNVGLTAEGAHYIIHDSCGFQSGNEKDIDDLIEFIKGRTTVSDISQRLHAIWYCIDSLRNRTLQDADKKLFALLETHDSNVPVVLVSTRLDRYETQIEAECKRAYIKKHGTKERALKSSDWDRIRELKDDAVEQFKEETRTNFQQTYPRLSGLVFTDADDETSISALMERTLGSIDNECVRSHLIKAQICSIDPKIDDAIKKSLELYKHAVRTAAAPIPVIGTVGGLVSTATVGGLIGKEIVGTFGFSGTSLDLGWETLTTCLTNKRALLGGMIGGELLTNGVVLGALSFTLPWAIPIVWGTRAAVNVLTAPQWGRMLLRTIADLILIMERAHWYSDEGKIDQDDIRSACNYYQEGDRQAKVHVDVDGLLGTFSINDTFNTTKLAAGLRIIVQKHRFQQAKE
ncbi:hypothetical protein KCU62_g9564, partial [Aureobasidium sp. EXF-3399]